MNRVAEVHVSASNLRHNIAEFKGLVRSSTAIAAVVKANAYGHGLQQVVKAIDGHIDYYQVDDVYELRELRHFTEKPALLLGHVTEAEAPEAILLNAEFGVFRLGQARMLGSIAEVLGRQLKIHVAIDALFGREGLLTAQIGPLLVELADLPSIQLGGIYSHFSDVENTAGIDHSKRQVAEYHLAVSQIKRSGNQKIVTHISATSGILAYERSHGENSLVRLGIGLYGLWPSQELRHNFEGNGIFLKPALRWLSTVASIKSVPKGYPIGYGMTFLTKRPTTLALIPQGYSDGYSRALSNNSFILVAGKKCPVIGRVSMNMLVADVTQVGGVQPDDEVVLIGTQEHEEVSADYLATRLDTINYEIVARISPRLTRVLVD